MVRVPLPQPRALRRHVLLALAVVAISLGASDTSALAFTPIPGNQAMALFTPTGSGCSSSQPVVSNDGRYVVFETTCAGVTAEGTGGNRQVYERDLQTDTTRMVSVNSSGTAGGNCDSSGYDSTTGAALSQDGRYVVFDSCATDLTAASNTGYFQVYERDMVTNTTRLVSVGQGSQYTCGSGGPFIGDGSVAVSGDGNYVVFRSCRPYASYSDVYDFFERNVSAGTTALVRSSYCHDIVGGIAVSDDGRYVAVGDCDTPPGCPDCANYVGYIYQRDMQGGTQLVSVAPNGDDMATGDGDNSYGGLAMSRNGRYVAFASDGQGSPLYLRDTQLHATYRVGPETGNLAQTFCADRPSISSDGRYVAFDCSSGTSEIYREDMQTGITRLVSASYYGTNANCNSMAPGMSGDGRYVAFISCATNLGSQHSSAYTTGYVRDMNLASGTGNGPISATEFFGRFNPAEPACGCSTGWEGDPVNTDTGDFSETQTDSSIPGNGPALAAVRSYDSLNATTGGMFGYGWSSSYGAHLVIDPTTHDVTVVQGSGAQVPYTADQNTGALTAPPRVTATLVKHGDGTYTFTTEQPGHWLYYAFDSAGALTAIADRNGYTTTLSRPSSAELIVTDPGGRQLSFALDGGRVQTLTDPAGNVTHFSYDGAGNLTDVTDPLGRHTSYAYDSSHRMTVLTDPRGGQTTNVYDSSGRVTSQTDPAGRTTEFDYDDSAHTTTITDPLRNKTVERYEDGFLVSKQTASGTQRQATWTYSYDPSSGAQLQVTDPKGKSTTRTVDDHGDVLTSTDQLGNTTSATYDAHGDLTSATDPLGTRTDYTYDSAGNLMAKSTPLGGGHAASWTYTYGSGSTAGDVLSGTDPRGKVTSFQYDGAGDRTATTDPLGHITHEAYDVLGRLTAKTSPRGSRTSYDYDADGELIAVIDPNGGKTTFGYDANGNQETSTDPNGHKTTTTYDADNKPTVISLPDGSTKQTAYDADGNVLTQTDGNGHKVTYAYDELNRATSVTDANGNTTTTSYDLNGNRTSTTDPNNRVTTDGYDDANELTSIHYSDGTTPTVTFGYDADGHRTTMTDGSGTSDFSFDNLGRLISQTDGAGNSIAYARDADGNITQITYPSGHSVARDYNDASQLTSVSDWLGHTVSFDYDADGNVTARHFPGGVDSHSQIDASGRTDAITQTANGQTLASYDYTRDPAGQLQSAHEAGDVSGSTDYTYDAAARLASSGTASFSYDPAGNPLRYAANQHQTFGADSAVRSSTVVSSPTTTATPGTYTVPVYQGTTTITPHSSGPVTLAKVTSTSTITNGRKLSTTVTPSRPGQLLVALISAGASAKISQSVSSVTSPGASWTRVTAIGHSGGTVSVWQATASKAKPLSIKIRLAAKTTNASATIAAFDPGATVSNYAGLAETKGPARVSVRAGKNSQVWAVGHDGSSSTARTLIPGDALVKQVRGPGRQASWVQRTTSNKGGAVQIGTRRPGSKRWAMAAVVLQQVSVSRTTKRSRGHSRALVSRIPAWRYFSYDRNGNRTSISAPSGSTTLTYDQANRLAGVGSDTYGYNGDDLRTSLTTGGTTSSETWDESSGLPLMLSNGSTSFVYGPNGGPIEQVSGDQATFLLTDQQGSTRLLTDPQGDVTGSYAYDAWGNTISHSGVDSPLQYDGAFTDSATGYQYLRARYYDPSTGQFLSRDPMQALTRAPYSFADNAPVNRSDPSGLWSFNLCVGGCIGYDSGNGWGVGFGVGAGVQVGHVQAGGGVSTIGYPHTDTLAWSAGVDVDGAGFSTEIDAQPGRITGVQACAGAYGVEACAGPDWKGSSGDGRLPQRDPIRMFENAHNEYANRFGLGGQLQCTAGWGTGPAIH